MYSEKKYIVEGWYWEKGIHHQQESKNSLAVHLLIYLSLFMHCVIACPMGKSCRISNRFPKA